MLTRRYLLAALSGLLAAHGLAGCAIPGATQRPAEEIVLERAQGRWNALLASNWAAAYRYATPAYRAVVSEQTYGNQFRGPVQWSSATAKSAKCEEKRCIVFVNVTFRLLAPGHLGQRGQTDIEETWVLEDGSWFKYEAL